MAWFVCRPFLLDVLLLGQAARAPGPALRAMEDFGRLRSQIVGQKINAGPRTADSRCVSICSAASAPAELLSQLLGTRFELITHSLVELHAGEIPCHRSGELETNRRIANRDDLISGRCGIN